MIKFLIFDINDTGGWDSTDFNILEKLKENDPLFSATKYTNKIINKNGTQCAMRIYTSNPVILNGLTEEQKNNLIEIQPNNPDWV